MSESKIVCICNQSKLAFDVPASVTNLIDMAAAIDVDRGQDTLEPRYSYVTELTQRSSGYHMHRVAADVAVDDLSEAEVIEIMFGKSFGRVQCTYNT